MEEIFEDSLGEDGLNCRLDALSCELAELHWE